jgi:hypothetical protein
MKLGSELEGLLLKSDLAELIKRMRISCWSGLHRHAPSPLFTPLNPAGPFNRGPMLFALRGEPYTLCLHY